MAHENSVTEQNEDGTWSNFSGNKGSLLMPTHEYEAETYDTMEEAVVAAKQRSEDYGKEQDAHVHDEVEGVADEVEGVAEEVTQEELDNSAPEEVVTPVNTERRTLTQEELDNFVPEEVVTPVNTARRTLTQEELDNFVPEGEPSVSRKVAYGFADEPMIGGSIMRAVETGFEAITEGKSWTQSRKDVEAERKAELYAAFPEFASGKYDGDGEVLAGRVSAAVVDPVTFLIPWTKAAKVGQTLSYTTKLAGKTSIAGKVANTAVSKAPLFALGAGFSAADYSLYSYMREGKVDTTGLFYVSAAGGTLTVAVEPFAKYLITKYRNKYGEGVTAPKLTKATSPDEVQKMMGDKAYKELTDKQKKTIDEVFELPTLKDLNGMLAKSTNMPEILAKQKARRYAISKQLAAKKITQRQANKERKKLTQEYDNVVGNIVDSRSKAIEDIVEHMHKRKTLSAKAFEYATRPVVGSLFMGGAGVIGGVDDEGLHTLMLAGLVTGAAQKYIQKHALIGDDVKKEITFGLVQRNIALSLQAAKYHTATTQVTKLKALGQQTSTFADMMHHTFSPKGIRQMAVEERAHSATQFWNMILVKDVIKGASSEVQQAAVRHIRGYSTKKDRTAEVLELSENLKKYLKSFKDYNSAVGINTKQDLDYYFPREYNYEAVDNLLTKLTLPINHVAYKEFSGKSLEETVALIFKKRDKISKESAKENAKTYLLTAANKKDADTITTSTSNFKLNKLPYVTHIEQERALHGTITVKGKTVQIEELLSPWLNKDIKSVLGNMAKESSRAVEFKRTFGKDGEVYRNLMRDINKKYEGLINTARTPKGTPPAKKANESGIQYETRLLAWQQKQADKSVKVVKKLEGLRDREHKRINGSIDAFFGRYGKKFDRAANSKGALVSLYNSMIMLEDVAIANLGDLVQPFQNSKGLRQTLKAWRETSWGAKGTSKRANEEAAALLGLIESDVIAVEARTSAGMADIGAKTRKTSDSFYKFTGLHQVTSFARRFAFNAGSRDLHTTSKVFQKMTSKMIRDIEKREGRLFSSFGSKKQQQLLFEHPNASNRQRLLERSQYFGVTEEELLAVAKYGKYEDAFQDESLRSLFQMAGFRAMERDAKIPTTGNRLLFTQSRDPRIRLLGQFTSWAQAKTAQTNSLIKRVEEGDAKLALKMMGALVIYTGIREVRDIIREGTFNTEEHTVPEIIARANDLSGNPGIWLGYMTSMMRDWSSDYNKDVNPLTMFPAGSTLTEVSKATGKAWEWGFEDDEWDWSNLDRLVPFPKIRNLLQTFFDEGYYPVTETEYEEQQYKEQQYKHIQKFSDGGLVTNPCEGKKGLELQMCQIQNTVHEATTFDVGKGEVSITANPRNKSLGLNWNMPF